MTSKIKKQFYKVDIVVYNSSLTHKTIIHLGEFDKISKAESLRAKIEENNPDRIISMRVQGYLDTAMPHLFDKPDEDDILNQLDTIKNINDLLE